MFVEIMNTWVPEAGASAWTSSLFDTGRALGVRLYRPWSGESGSQRGQQRGGVTWRWELATQQVLLGSGLSVTVASPEPEG